MPDDIKLQLVRGDVHKADFRDGEFVGAPLDHHRTIAEVENADVDLVDVLFNPNRLEEYIEDGDSIADVVNRVLDLIAEKQPSTFGKAASLMGLEGTGLIRMQLRVYSE